MANFRWLILVVVISIGDIGHSEDVDLKVENLTPTQNHPRGFENVINRKGEDGIGPSLGGMLTLGLLGSGLALMRKSPSVEVNRRGYYYDDPYYYQDDYYPYDTYDRRARNYAARVRAFEKRVIGGIGNALKSGTRRFGRASRNLAKSMRYGAKNTARAAANGVRKVGLAAGQGMVAAAKATRNGIKRAGKAAAYGASRVGDGLANVGKRTNRLGRKLARVGVAAARGLAKVRSSYARTAARARSSFKNVGRTYSRGISRIGKATQRGLYNFANSYKRRLGRVQPDLRYAVYDGVSRIGEMASDGASKIGDLASDGAAKIGGLATDGVNKISEVASVVPKSLSSVAKEKEIQDCFLQTMCYISAPYLDKNDIKRRKRAIDEYAQSRGLQQEPDERGYGSKERLLDECEVFNCKIAYVGRKAYGWYRS